jgi:hypothetical protein
MITPFELTTITPLQMSFAVVRIPANGGKGPVGVCSVDLKGVATKQTRVVASLVRNGTGCEARDQDGRNNGNNDSSADSGIHRSLLVSAAFRTALANGGTEGDLSWQIGWVSSIVAL